MKLSQIKREKSKRFRIKNKSRTRFFEKFIETEVFMLKTIFEKLKRDIYCDMYYKQYRKGYCNPMGIKSYNKKKLDRYGKFLRQR